MMKCYNGVLQKNVMKKHVEKIKVTQKKRLQPVIAVFVKCCMRKVLRGWTVLAPWKNFAIKVIPHYDG